MSDVAYLANLVLARLNLLVEAEEQGGETPESVQYRTIRREKYIVALTRLQTAITTELESLRGN